MKQEHSAGGIIFNNDKILTISWTTMDYICFPKGHIEPGETSAEAAVREVFEETGYHTEIISFIDSSNYDRLNYAVPYHKTVDYYLMKLIDDAAPTPHREKGEDFENLWLPVDEALERLKYDDAKNILKQAVDRQVASVR